MRMSIDITTGELPPNATHAIRRWAWVPSSVPNIAGTLTIVGQGVNRMRGTLDSYRVRITPYEIELEKLKKGEPTGEFYGVFAGIDRNNPERCNCRAGQCGTPCKHLEAMRAMLAEVETFANHTTDTALAEVPF